MNNTVTYRPANINIVIKLFFWFFFSLPILAAALPMLDMLTRKQIDWPGVAALFFVLCVCVASYGFAVYYNKKLSQTVVWLANQMGLQAYVSKGVLPGFIYWPEVSGSLNGHFVLIKMTQRGRYQFTDMVLPLPLVDSQNLKNVLDKKSNTLLPDDLEIVQTQTSYVCRVRGSIVEKQVAQKVLRLFSLVTNNPLKKPIS